MRECYIFDIDGTLANNSHRTHHLQKSPKDWKSYHEGVADDSRYLHICILAKDLLSAGKAVVFCTGRHEGQRHITQDWLVENVAIASHDLYMRTENDHRPDHIIKLELLQQIRKDGFYPIMVFDDRNSVVKMWRENGVPCAQVAEGDF
jgi:hypothetical protein